MGTAPQTAFGCTLGRSMCMVIYIASRSPLPLMDTPAFNVTELTPSEEPVRRHFVQHHIRQAGSHTGCGCGFNEGREYSGYGDPAAAIQSSSQLAQYVVEHRVERIYSCWSGDEGKPQELERRVAPETLIGSDFYFREKEALVLTSDAAPKPILG